MQKRTKVLLVTFLISLSVLIGMIVWTSSNNAQPNNTEYPGATKPPDIVVTASPIPLNDSSDFEDSKEVAKGLTNNQKYSGILADKDSRNVLLIGEDPTWGNYDTIIIVSINEKKNVAKIINFLRDIYIDYNSSIIDAVNKVERGFFVKNKGTKKINAAPFIASRLKYKKNTGRFSSVRINFMADLMEEVFNIHIDDYVIFKQDGFVKLVDLFGGVDIYVPCDMYYEDPSQDLSIHLEKGMQHLNGTQAEGFVRYRQGYDKYGNEVGIGDEGRKANQIAFIKAFFKQHATLSNLNKLGQLSEIISKNVQTSIKGWTNILKYGNILRKFLSKKYNIEEKIVKGKPEIIDGVDVLVLD